MTCEEILIEDTEWRAMTTRERLQHYIQTDTEQGDYRERKSFWDDILGVGCGGYNSEVDDSVISVVERMLRKEFFAENVHEELISYILCSADLAEYGTSPRGAWICHDIADLMPAALERWKQDF
ncbi:MAG: hypothetical protein MK130_05115 [Puniceicoccaceae bacterium]|nr:hypothetical protein [Puniceicoccaceae bacterium]